MNLLWGVLILFAAFIVSASLLIFIDGAKQLTRIADALESLEDDLTGDEGGD